MHPKLLTLFAGVLMTVSFGATAVEVECNAPTAPENIPDGNSAGESEMMEAQKSVKDFVAEGQKYLGCVEKAIDRAKEEVTAAMEEQREQEGEGQPVEQTAAMQKHQDLVKLYNKMIGEMEAVADEFNQALRDYNSNAE